MEDCAEKRLQCGPAGGDQRKAGPVLLAADVGEGRAEAGVRQPRAVAGDGLAPAGALRHPPLAAAGHYALDITLRCASVIFPRALICKIKCLINKEID